MVHQRKIRSFFIDTFISADSESDGMLVRCTPQETGKHEGKGWNFPYYVLATYSGHIRRGGETYPVEHVVGRVYGTGRSVPEAFSDARDAMHHRIEVGFAASRAIGRFAAGW